MKRFPVPVLAGVAVALALLAAPAAQAQPVTNSTLYYRLGGGSPVSGSLYDRQLAMRLGLNVRLNYSCGKFDIGLSWKNLMNSVKDLGGQVSGAIQSAISSLPLYILQRAQPGLYQLFQNYSAKADLLTSAALKTCEEMERMIKNGEDPYEDWVRLAKGDAWKSEADGSGDIVSAKVSIDKNESGQNKGIAWVFGANAGGVGMKPIQPVRDLSVAGYNVVMNRPPTEVGASSPLPGASSTSRLAKAFRTPEDLAAWTTQVLGDKEVYTCSQKSCPQPTATTTATGLGPKLDEELNAVRPILQEVVRNPGSATKLRDVAASGFALSPQLMDAVRRMPQESQSLAVARLSEEMAMHRVVEKALVARNVLLTGLSLPAATKAPEMQKDVQAQIDRLTQHINDLMFEYRIRKEMTSETALAIMGERRFGDTRSDLVPSGSRADQQPLQDGRVKTN